MPVKPFVSTVPWERPFQGSRASVVRWLRRAAMPVVCMALLSFVSSAVTAWWIANENQRAMARDTGLLVDRIQQRFNDYAQVDVGVRSFWTVHQPLKHDDLAMYVAGLDLANRYPGLQTVTVSEVVPGGQSAAFDEHQRQVWSAYTHGQVAFERHGATILGTNTVRNFLDNGPDIGREVVTYLEPWQSYPYAVGRELTDDPVMVAALKLGRDQNVAVAGNIIMAHTLNGEKFPGLGIRLPLYQGAPDSVEQRRQHYVGSVGVGIRLDQFFNRILVDRNLFYLDMQVFTTPTENGTPETLKRWMVYDSRRQPAHAPFSLVSGRWTQRASINLGGYRVWAIIANNGLPTNAYSPLWSVIIGVITFAGLFILWVLADSAADARRRAVRLTAIATQDLEKQQAMIEQAAQMAGVGHWHLDVTDNRLRLSAKAEEILGFPSLPLHPKVWAEQLDPDDRTRWRTWFNDLIGVLDNRDKPLEYRYKRGDEVLWISIIGRRVDQGRGPVTLQGSLMDVSQRKRDELELRLKHRLGSIAATDPARLGRSDERPGLRSRDVLLGTRGLDEHGLFDTFVQRLCEEMGQAAGRFWLFSPTAHRFERKGVWGRDVALRAAMDAWTDAAWTRTMDETGGVVRIEHRPEQVLTLRADWPVTVDGQAVAWIELYDTQRRQAQVADLREPTVQRTIGQEAVQLVRYHEHYTRLNYLAGTDPLTGLMSRYRFGETLRERLRSPGAGHGVLFIDLDGFKKVNDSLGHAAGDQVLQEIAQRFCDCLGPSDIIGRMGGDEFAVLTTTPLRPLNQMGTQADPEPVMDLATRLLNASERPFRVNGQPCFLSASIGIALVPDDGAVAVDVIKRADIAMYAVKKSGKNGHQRYAPVHEEAAVLRNELETALKEAPANEELRLVFQPKYRLDDAGRPTPIGVESLLRWRHPTLGAIAPDEFIAIAEDNGDIHALGRWVMQRVVQHMQQWDSMGLAGLCAAVNISPRQFLDETSLNECLALIDEAGLDPHRITLEITEGCLMEAPERSQAMLQRLHERGFRIAIDDFGMGYSSLAYLKTFHVDEIKIDKTFVQNMAHSPQDVAIVDAILNMARSLGMEVVAEGVETASQMALLRSMGCALFQGYLFSKPQEAADLPGHWTCSLSPVQHLADVPDEA